jgi:hypothetical protein
MLKRGSRTDPWVVHVRMRSSGGCARPRLLLIPAPPATPAKSRTPGYARRRDGPMTSERRSNCEFCRALGGVRLHVAAQFGRSRVGERWRAFLPAMTGRRPPGAGIVLDSRFRCWPPTPPRRAPRADASRTSDDRAPSPGDQDRREGPAAHWCRTRDRGRAAFRGPWAG